MQGMTKIASSRPRSTLHASSATVASVAACTLLWACASSQHPEARHAPATRASATAALAPEEPVLGRLLPVATGLVEPALDEAPVTHGIAMSSSEQGRGVSSAYDSHEVERVVARQLGAIRDCLERKERRAATTTAGKVTVAFTILPAGHVRDVRALHNGTGSDVTAGCVLSSLRALTFAPSAAGQSGRFEYAFVFGAGDAGRRAAY